MSRVLDIRASQEASRADAAGRPVRRRLVIYVPGFDPAGGARYFKIFKTELTRWARRFGGEVAVSRPDRADGGARWTASARLAGETGSVDIAYRVAPWSDLATARMRAGTVARLRRGLACFAALLVDGSLARMLAQARIPAIVTLYPFVFALGYALAAAGLAIAPPLAAAALIDPAAIGARLVGIAGGAAVGLGLAAGALRWSAAIDRTTFTYYLLDSYTLMRAFSRGGAPELQARVDQVAGSVVAAAQGLDDAGGSDAPWDEILVVGHSSGSALAASALARALRRDPDLPRRGPAIGLLTLGQTLSAQAVFAGAEALVAEFRAVAAAEGVAWVDVSSRADGVCYALCDPLVGRDPAPPPEARRAGPKVVSAKFHETVAPESFARFRRNHFRRHFQYLYVFEHPQEYDFFRIAAGSRTLADRFADAPTNFRVPKTAAEAARDAAAGRVEEPAR